MIYCALGAFKTNQPYNQRGPISNQLDRLIGDPIDLIASIGHRRISNELSIV